MYDSEKLTPEEIADNRRRAKEDMDSMFEKAKKNPIPIPKSIFIKEKRYSRMDIHSIRGGGIQDYLPHVDNKVVCACLRLDYNPEAPKAILVGNNDNVVRWANVFRDQSEFVPTFIKRADAEWEYIGDYRVKDFSEDPKVVASHAKKANRDDVVQVLFLEAH